MFPKKKFLESTTSKLIVLNIAIFILVWIFVLIFGDANVLDILALKPSSLFNGQNVWTLITSMFVHFSFWHLVVNMFSFYFVGNFVEKLIGSKRLILAYISSGIFAGLFWSVLSYFFGSGLIGSKVFGDPLIYGVGASGALFGLVGVLAILTPHKKVYLLAGPIVAIIIQYVLYGLFPSMDALMGVVGLLINIYIILVLFSMFSFGSRRKLALPIELSFWLLPIVAIVPLILIGLFMDLPIGNMAHLGGLLFGLFYAYILKLKFPNKTKYLSRKVI